ncbi:MAG: polyamine aminopropyltransferase [Candidatus Omnitrophica bacterium]|nr:polyamine aminopropyltransferase [Candidatus Omnitrophota bacterium]
MWFFETLYPDLKIGVKGDIIHEEKTPFQDMKIYHTSRYGKVLTLDGVIQTTQKDEFIYHEMLTHPLLLSHPKPQNVLIIGAGDGGILREVLKHKVKKVTLVEIDQAVIEVSKKHLATINKGSFNDKRAKIVVGDGAKFVKNTKEKFDVIVVDSTDPIGPAKVLFSENFYLDIYRILTKNGLMIRQTGSATLQLTTLKNSTKTLKKVFPIVRTQIIAVPTYIGGFFSLTIGSKTIDTAKVTQKAINQRYAKLKLKTKYYNPDIHFACTKLPNYIGEELR